MKAPLQVGGEGNEIGGAAENSSLASDNEKRMRKKKNGTAEVQANTKKKNK